MEVEKLIILTQKDQETALFWQENDHQYLFLQPTTRRHTLENVTTCSRIWHEGFH